MVLKKEIPYQSHADIPIPYDERTFNVSVISGVSIKHIVICK